MKVPQFPLRTDELSLSTKEVSNSHIKIGVIGLGYWGPKLARNFNELPASKLIMVSDLRQDRLEDIQGNYPDVIGTHNYVDLLDHKVDAVVIATPVHTHYNLAKAALEAGKHVLVEKPITSRSDHAQELIDLAAGQKLVLMVGHTFLYNPAVEAIREIVQSGELGNIFYMNSTRANLGLLQPDINVMWDLAPHDISILRYILGKDPIKVSAHGAVYVNLSQRLYEVVYLNLYFERDMMANLRLSWLDPVKQRRLTIVGSKKMLVYDDILDAKIMLYDKGVEVPPYSITEEQFRASYRHGSETVYPINWVEPLKAECSHFLECIRTGASPRSDGQDGLQVLKILESAQRSLNNGGCELLVEYS